MPSSIPLWVLHQDVHLSLRALKGRGSLQLIFFTC